MLKLKSPFLFMLVCCAAIIMLPFVFLTDRGLVSVESVQKTSVVLLIIELVVYGLWIGFFTNSTVFVIVLAPVALALFRAFLAGLTSVYLANVTEQSALESYYLLWFGHPLAFVLQVFILIYLLPIFLTFAWPTCLLGTKYENLFTFDTSESSAKPAAPAESGSIVGPAGGIYELLTLNDLSNYFKKITGLEGYAIFTSESLTYSHNMPVSHGLDVLGVRAKQLWESYGAIVNECELEDAQELMIGTLHYQVYISPVDDDFYAIFIFNKTLSRDNCSRKMQVMLKSARSFLSTHYALS